MNAEPEVSPSGQPWPSVGHKIRTTRGDRGMSLRELARRLQVSPGQISQIERGLVTPSMSLLYSIVSELQLSLDNLFGNGDPAGTGAAAPAPERTPGEGRFITRADGRKAINLASGVRWEMLTPASEEKVDFREIIYAAGGQSTVGEQFIRHSGREYGLMLEGVLTVQIEFDEYSLGPGDSIAFDSALPHRFWNSGAQPARAVWCSIGAAGDSHPHP